MNFLELGLGLESGLDLGTYIELLNVFSGKKEKAQIIEFMGKNQSRLENTKFGPSLSKPKLVYWGTEGLWGVIPV